VLAAALYSDPKDIVAAKEMVCAQLAAGRRGNNGGGLEGPAVLPERDVVGSGESEKNPLDGLAHSVAMRFEYNAAKLSGGLDESCLEYVAEYLNVARVYNLTSAQRLKFLHKLLAGEATRFYLESVQTHLPTFIQAVDVMSAEHNSVVPQSRVNNHLSTPFAGRGIYGRSNKGVRATEALGGVRECSV